MDSGRRTLLKAGVGAGVATTTLGSLRARPADARPGAARLPRDPFTLGVASGDPWPNGFVLWTRLAVRPLAGDGRGGMPRAPFDVHWAVAEDPAMSRVVRRGTAVARPAFGHAVHVTLQDLRPGREFWYRFRVGTWVSPVGRTRTAPAALSMPESLSMAFVSCSQYEHGYFTAYRHLANDGPDVVLHLGDYQYEYRADTYVAPSGNVRDHAGPETTDLATYRQRHAQYKTDPDLQAAHGAAPWLVVWDDHELEDNWADESPDHPQKDFTARRAAAFRAFYENMPLRRSSAPRGIDLQLYRRARWGRLASFHLLDTRQFRDDQACGDGYRDGCAAAVNPSRSITGDEQERWLVDGFQSSTVRWDLIAQQVFFAQRDVDSGPLKPVKMDAWDGYAASRNRITRGWLDAAVRNPVVLTGDVHAHWASDLKLDYDEPASPTVGAELVCSSITSSGDGADATSGSHPWLENNPHLRFHSDLRGYVRATVTADQLTADFRCVRRVSRVGSLAFTRASFTVHDQQPGLELTYDNPPADPPRRRSDEAISDATIRIETQRP